MPAPIATTAPPALYRIARAFICVLHDLFGAPEDIARAHALTHAAYKILLSWIRAGEAMMRRLIAIEADAFAPATTSVRVRTPRRSRRRVRRRVVIQVEPTPIAGLPAAQRARSQAHA